MNIEHYAHNGTLCRSGARAQYVSLLAASRVGWRSFMRPLKGQWKHSPWGVTFQGRRSWRVEYGDKDWIA